MNTYQPLSACLAVTSNGIHVLCMIPTIVEKSTASGQWGECRPSPEISNGLRSSPTPCFSIELVAVHCQVGYNEAPPFSMFLKIAFKQILCVILVERERKCGCISLLRQLTTSLKQRSCLNKHDGLSTVYS